MASEVWLPLLIMAKEEDDMNVEIRVPEQWLEGFTKTAEAAGVTADQMPHFFKLAQALKVRAINPGVFDQGYDEVMQGAGLFVKSSAPYNMIKTLVPGRILTGSKAVKATRAAKSVRGAGRVPKPKAAPYNMINELVPGRILKAPAVNTAPRAAAPRAAAPAAAPAGTHAVNREKFDRVRLERARERMRSMYSGNSSAPRPAAAATAQNVVPPAAYASTAQNVVPPAAAAAAPGFLRRSVNRVVDPAKQQRVRDYLRNLFSRRQTPPPPASPAAAAVASGKKKSKWPGRMLGAGLLGTGGLAAVGGQELMQDLRDSTEQRNFMQRMNRLNAIYARNKVQRDIINATPGMGGYSGSGYRPF